jgi:hypothetical protein
MVKNIIILFIAFYFITLQVPVFASGWNLSSGHFAVKHYGFSRHKSNHTSRSFVKHKLKFHRKWALKTKGTNRITLPYYIYYPPHASYGIEEVTYLQITVIDDNKKEQIEPTVDINKSYSPPRIVNWEDIALQKSTEGQKSSEKKENVILIYGTKMIEATISSD